jgi:hypothetical protein
VIVGFYPAKGCYDRKLSWRESREFVWISTSAFIYDSGIWIMDEGLRD